LDTSGYVRVGDKWYYLLHPRPVYIIAAARGGRVNFMAASWVMPFSEEPPRIVTALEKESLTREYAVESGFFSVNVLSVEHVDFIYAAGTVSGRRVDKASMLGARFEFDPDTGVPWLAQPKPMGFIIARIHRLYTDLAEDVDLVVADVVSAYADPGLFNERFGWDLRRARVAMHAAGRGFTTAQQLFVARRRQG
jgi:flavin reductase (DIM6/NTAB) family NADH-FMN oxidoreductase RutF